MQMFFRDEYYPQGIFTLSPDYVSPRDVINSSQLLDSLKSRIHNVTSNRDEDFEIHLTPQKEILSNRNWYFFAKTDQSENVEK